MNIPYAPAPEPRDPYFDQMEPHHFRFDGTGCLTLHADDDGRYLGVYIEVQYKDGPEHYLRLRIRYADVSALVEWFKAQDEQPF